MKVTLLLNTEITIIDRASNTHFNLSHALAVSDLYLFLKPKIRTKNTDKHISIEHFIHKRAVVFVKTESTADKRAPHLNRQSSRKVDMIFQKLIEFVIN